MKELGLKLKYYRDNCELSQQQVANILNIDRSTYTYYEPGKTTPSASMLLKLSNGGVARISENRNVGWKSPETYISQYYGTDGGYEFAVAHHYHAQWDPENRNRVIMKDVSEQLHPAGLTKGLKENYDDAIQQIADTVGIAGFRETSPIQDTSRLPKAYEGMPNGHNGTHHFLIDDFCKAFATGKLSPTNIWAAARYNIPGLVAQESAMQGGVLMEVPDLGDAPADWELIDPYDFDYNQGK